MAYQLQSDPDYDTAPGFGYQSALRSKYDSNTDSALAYSADPDLVEIVHSTTFPESRHPLECAKCRIGGPVLQIGTLDPCPNLFLYHNLTIYARLT